MNQVKTLKQKEKLNTYHVYFWEWDCDNGEYITKQYYPSEVKAKDISKALDKIVKWLEQDVKEAESNGWECDEISGDIVDDNEAYISTTCYKLDKKCVEEYKDEYEVEDELNYACSYSHQMGYDIIKANTE